MSLLIGSPCSALTKKKPAAEENAAPVCRAELLMEAESGEILYEQNIHESLAPASMVKMMVSYVTMKKVQEGAVKMSDMITVSKLASKIGGSQVYLKEGEQFTLAQLLEAVLIQSANDAATAIAEHIGGSPEGFVEFMDAETEALGMKESVFYNPPTDCRRPRARRLTSPRPTTCRFWRGQLLRSFRNSSSTRENLRALFATVLS